MGLCNSNEACKVDPGIDFSNNFAVYNRYEDGSREYVTSSHIGNDKAPAVPKEFFERLPVSKVILVNGSKISPEKEKPEPPKLKYNQPDDFCIPRELCLNQELGLTLVSLLILRIKKTSDCL